MTFCHRNSRQCILYVWSKLIFVQQIQSCFTFFNANRMFKLRCFAFYSITLLWKLCSWHWKNRIDYTEWRRKRNKWEKRIPRRISKLLLFICSFRTCFRFTCTEFSANIEPLIEWSYTSDVYVNVCVSLSRNHEKTKSRIEEEEDDEDEEEE